MPWGGFPMIEGRLIAGETVRNRFASDFGGRFREVPALVAFPKHAEDVAVLLSHACAAGIPIAVRGKGHSTEGQSLVEGGISLATQDLRFPEILRESGSGRVRAGAGSTWREIALELAKKDLAVPVLPEYLGMSLGGTLSGAGLGKGSHRHGTQLDLVESLRVVTFDGRIHDCSPSREANLFNASLGGLGKCGVIVEAEFRVMPLPPSLDITLSVFPSHEFKAVLEGLANAASDPGTFSIVAQNVSVESVRGMLRGGWDGALERDKKRAWILQRTSLSKDGPASFLNRIPYRDFILRLEKAPRFKARFSPDVNGGEKARDAEGNETVQPWFDALVSKGAAEAVLPAFSRLELGPIDTLAVTPVRCTGRLFDSGLFRYPENVRAGEVFYCLTLIRSTADSAILSRWLEENARLLDQVIDAGGKNYVIDGIRYPEAWVRHLGKHGIERFLAMREKYASAFPLSDPFSINRKES